MKAHQSGASEFNVRMIEKSRRNPVHPCCIVCGERNYNNFTQLLNGESYCVCPAHQGKKLVNYLEEKLEFIKKVRNTSPQTEKSFRAVISSCNYEGIKKLECTDSPDNIDIKYLKNCEIDLDKGYIKFNNPEYFTYDAIKEAVNLLYSQEKSFHFSNMVEDLNFFLCLTNITGESDIPEFDNFYPFTRIGNQTYSSNLVDSEKYPMYCPCSATFFGWEQEYKHPIVCGKQYYDSLPESYMKSFIRYRIGETA